MNLFRWVNGRQGTGYTKMLLVTAKWPILFDVYLLKYEKGAYIPIHKDPVEGREHWRFNLVLKRSEGGVFGIASYTIRPRWFFNNRGCLFRPDISSHFVTEVRSGTRYVLSIGWLR